MNGCISDMSCTCPYAEDGKNCKHMAAVLFAVKTMKKDADKASNKNSSLDIKELVTLRKLLEAATPEQLKVFLLEQMYSDVALQQDFRLRFAESVSQEDMRCYKHMIHQMFCAYTDEDRGEYDYYDEAEADALGLVVEISNFADRYLKPMLEKQDHESAFWLISDIAGALDAYNISKYGVSDEIAQICRKYWSTILEENRDSTLNQKMFEWFQEAMFDSDAAGEVMLNLCI